MLHAAASGVPHTIQVPSQGPPQGGQDEKQLIDNLAQLAQQLVATAKEPDIKLLGSQLLQQIHKLQLQEQKEQQQLLGQPGLQKALTRSG